jgi:signal transduction histidine kinase
MAPIPGLHELFDQVARGEPVVNYPLEGALVTDPTEYRYWNVSYFPVYGPNGIIQGITAASQEITQQKKAEKALIESEKLAAVGRLAASIAHEINNPLEAVTNLLYLARLSTNLEEVPNLLQAADTELRRVSAIAAQTLRFHRQSSSPQAIESAALVNEMYIRVGCTTPMHSFPRACERNAPFCASMARSARFSRTLSLMR